MSELAGDELDFLSDDDQGEDNAGSDQAWKVLIVDDDEFIHRMTKLVPKSHRYRDLNLSSATSGDAAIEILRKEADIAIVLLDMIMEADDAGLVIARRVQHELGNNRVVIVVRTGQPGMFSDDGVKAAPEIDGCRTKTELTAVKLKETVDQGAARFLEQIASILTRSALARRTSIHCLR